MTKKILGIKKTKAVNKPAKKPAKKIVPKAAMGVADTLASLRDLLARETTRLESQSLNGPLRLTDHSIISQIVKNIIAIAHEEDRQAEAFDLDDLTPEQLQEALQQAFQALGLTDERN